MYSKYQMYPEEAFLPLIEEEFFEFFFSLFDLG